MNLVTKLTHDQIAEIGAQKLKRLGYIATFANVTSAAAGEQPDSIGIKASGETFLIETKISRSDFLADKKKPWRGKEYKALGHYRAYLTPKGLLKLEEIPYGWQLWEVHGKKKPVIKVIKGEVKKKDPSGRTGWTAMKPINCDAAELQYFYDKACVRSALGLMATIVNRMDAEGVDTQQFASRGGKGFLKR